MYAVVPHPSPAARSPSLSSQLLEQLSGCRAFNSACLGLGLDHPALDDLELLERALECDLMDLHAGHLSDYDLSRTSASLASREREAEKARQAILATTDPATHMAILMAVAAGSRPWWELEEELSHRHEHLARGQGDQVLPRRRSLLAGLRPLSRTGLELIARALGLSPLRRRLDTEEAILAALTTDLDAARRGLEPQDQLLLAHLLHGPTPSEDLDSLSLARLQMAGLCFESLRGPEKVAWVPEELIQDLAGTLPS